MQELQTFPIFSCQTNDYDMFSPKYLNVIRRTLHRRAVYRDVYLSILLEQIRRLWFWYQGIMNELINHDYIAFAAID